MERAVQIYAVVNFAVIGLSHVARPRVWVEFFVPLLRHGEAGIFVVAVLNLVFGSVIVAFHNVWSGFPLLVTLLGWVNVAKAAFYFTFPGVALRKIRANPGPIRAAGSSPSAAVQIRTIPPGSGTGRTVITPAIPPAWPLPASKPWAMQ
jgi:hypothetical protein